MLIYIVIIPFAFLINIYQNRKNIQDFKTIEDFQKAQQYKIETYIEQYGFLSCGLKEDFWFWDIVIMYRKIAIIFAVEFLRKISP